MLTIKLILRCGREEMMMKEMKKKNKEESKRNYNLIKKNSQKRKY